MKLKVSGFITEQLLLFFIIFSVLLSGSYSFSLMIKNRQAENIRRECDALDNALLWYAKSHRSALKPTVTFRNNKDDEPYLFWQSGDIYPAELEELKMIRSEQGYFSDHLDLNKFSYSTRIEPDGRMTYRLEVMLPNGETYISPRSTQ